MAPPLLTLQTIGLTFGGTALLENADLSVSAGERLCLVGRNGSGKSTFLKIAAGLVQADRGEAFRPAWHDHPLSAPGAGPSRDMGRSSTMSRPVWPPATTPTGPTTCWSGLGLKRHPGSGPAFGRRGPALPPWPASWRPNRIFCCSTSRPTIWTCRPSNGWRRN